MVDPGSLTSVRKSLGLTQEQMARLLGVSFVSVNRWEGGHSSPVGGTRDLYAAIDTALKSDVPPTSILRAAVGERGVFLYTLFKLAYGSKKRAPR